MLDLYDAEVRIDNQSNSDVYQRHLGVLADAADVKVSREINGDYTLDFKYPSGTELFEKIAVNCIVKCEEQLFRIMRISYESAQMAQIACLHVFNCDAKRFHVPNIGSTDTSDTIGVSPYSVINSAFEGTPFTVLSYEKVQQLGMKWVGASDGFLIDFESVDKTTPYDVMMQVIENCGRGEIYVNNTEIALVERLGTDRDICINPAKNMRRVTVDIDNSDMVTRLYPYGKDDMTIASADNNTDKTVYIDSPEIKEIPAGGRRFYIEGCRDYSDYYDPDKLYERALWEFDEENPDRIDVPSVNITGEIADLSRIYPGEQRLELGDRVNVMYNGKLYYERIISISRHPFEAEPDTVSIGRVKKDMFFYLNQIGALAKRYANISTSSGKIYGAKISGSILKLGAGDIFAKSDGLYYNGKKLKFEEGQE